MRVRKDLSWGHEAVVDEDGQVKGQVVDKAVDGVQLDDIVEELSGEDEEGRDRGDEEVEGRNCNNKYSRNQRIIEEQKQEELPDGLIFKPKRRNQAVLNNQLNQNKSRESIPAHQNLI